MGRDQGLSRPERRRRTRRANAADSAAGSRACCISDRGCGSRCCSALPLVWLLDRVHRLARRAARHVAVPLPRPTRPAWCRTSSRRRARRTTTACSSTARLPRRSRSARSARRCSVTVIDLVIALPVAFYMAKIASPWLRRALVVGGDHAAVGGLSRQGLRVAGDARSRGRRAARGVRPLARLRADRHDRSRCRISGCRSWSSRSTRGSSDCRTRCSKRRPISARRRAARSCGSCCRSSGRRSSPARSSRSRSTLGDFYMNADRRRHDAVHRQHRVPRVQRQPAVRGGVRDAADRDHGRLPARGARSTGALEEL